MVPYPPPAGPEPQGPVRSGEGAPASCGCRSGPAALGGSRRGWFADAELRVGEERDARGSGEKGGVRGGRGESRCKAAAREAGARAAGGRRWHRFREPRRLRSEIRNRAPSSGSPAPATARRLPAPGSRRPRPLLLPAPPRSRPLPLEEGSREPAEAAPEEEAAAAALPPVPADPEPPRRAVCVRVCRALAPCLAHA